MKSNWINDMLHYKGVRHYGETEEQYQKRMQKIEELENYEK